MQTVNTIGTPAAAYAAAPQQAAFAPPPGIDLPAPDDVPRENGESGGEPPPDLLGDGSSRFGSDANDDQAAPFLAGAAYDAGGHALAAGRSGARLDLLAA